MISLNSFHTQPDAAAPQVRQFIVCPSIECVSFIPVTSSRVHAVAADNGCACIARRARRRRGAGVARGMHAGGGHISSTGRAAAFDVPGRAHLCVACHHGAHQVTPAESDLACCDLCRALVLRHDVMSEDSAHFMNMCRSGRSACVGSPSCTKGHALCRADSLCAQFPNRIPDNLKSFHTPSQPQVRPIRPYLPQSTT